MSKEISPTIEYFIDLLRALVHGSSVPTPYSGVDMLGLYAVSEEQGLSCMLYHALYKLPLNMEDERTKHAMERFRAAHKAYVRHSVMQDVEFMKVSAALDAAGVEYCPLKGWYTRELYPEQVMRYLADIDVLIHPEDSAVVYTAMTGLGYTCTDYMKHDDDTYRKNGINIEMHRCLDTEGLKDASLYMDPFALTENVGGGCRRMRVSDAYLYTLVHGMKHFMYGGTGLRTLLDIYLYLKNAELDRSYISSCAVEMGIEKFAYRMEELAGKVFGGLEAGADIAGCKDELDDEAWELVRFMLKSGAGGKTKTLDASLLTKSGKGGKNGSRASYVFSLIFPPMRYMRKRDPILKKAPVLLPFMHVRRWFQLVFSKRERIKSGIDRYNDIEDSAVDELRRIHELAGLE